MNQIDHLPIPMNTQPTDGTGDDGGGGTKVGERSHDSKKPSGDDPKGGTRGGEPTGSRDN